MFVSGNARADYICVASLAEALVHRRGKRHRSCVVALVYEQITPQIVVSRAMIAI